MTVKPEPGRRIRVRHPETSVLTEGFDPELSVMAARPPIYPVSTYCFHSAEEARRYFDVALERSDEAPDQSGGLIYARLNNPNAEIFEHQMVPLEAGAVEAAAFASGMSAITAIFFTFLHPGDVVLYTRPVYGGTAHVLGQLLPPFGITAVAVDAGDADALCQEAERLGDRLAMIYVETPANPTLSMTDIAAASRVARAMSDRRPVRLVIDNTFLGPTFQSPLRHGADLVTYSATKSIGGHSDLVGGVTLAHDTDLIRRLKTHRSFFGTICEPFSSWLLSRSLATIYTRTIKQSKNAARIVDRLSGHKKIRSIRYPTRLDGDQKRIYRAQCTAPGSMITLEIEGGEAGAFRFLNGLHIAKLAVSLGSVESLATHPRTTTSSEMAPEEMDRVGITDGLVRLSIGVEYWRDLAADFEQALDAV